MRKLLTCSLLLCMSFQANALNESTALKEIKSNILNNKSCSKGKFWNLMRLKIDIHTKYWSKNPYNLVVSKFGCELGAQGSVVISPGRTESSVEFYETAVDLVDQGFSPVYVVDHIGQGFSPRLLPDEKKGHILRFSDYVNAFDSAVKAVQKDLENKYDRKKERDPLYFLSNSMGGAIGIGYFQKTGKENAFSAAVLLGPMIRINYLGFPDGDPTKPNGITHPSRLQSKIFSERLVIKRAQLFCKTLGCDAYATKGAQEMAKKYGTAYLEGRRDFVTAFEKAPEQVMTHSKQRYNLKTFLWEDARMKKLYQKYGVSNPQLGAPTFQWVKQAARFNNNMRSSNNISKMSKMPMMIITGEKDVRAYTPKKDGSTTLEEHVKFCNKVDRSPEAGSCKFVQIDKAFHELHKESDTFRRPTLKKVIEHFKAN